MPEKKYKWHKIAETMNELQFGERELILIEISGRKICVAKTSKGLSACAAKCPHAGGDMSQGYLDKKGNIVCPVHRYIFNLENGRDVSGEGYFLKVYPVKETDSGIFLGIEEGGLFNWLK